MKIKVQAQHLKPDDIVGSGERIIGVLINSTKFASNKVFVTLRRRNWLSQCPLGQIYTDQCGACRMKVTLPDGEIKDLSEWMAEGSRQQQKVIEAMIEKYFIRLRLQQTLRIIDRILNDRYR